VNLQKICEKKEKKREKKRKKEKKREKKLDSFIQNLRVMNLKSRIIEISFE
jgi:hypothetical protein